MAKQLPVHYRSQWDSDARDHDADCGPTSIAMVLNTYGIDITPDRFYDHIPTPKSRTDYTTFTELMRAGQALGLEFEYRAYVGQGEALQQLKANIDAGRPLVTLVKYHPWRNTIGNRFSGGHFVVAVGYDDQNIYMNDPLFGGWATPTRDAGDHYKMSTALFLQGWGGFPADENPNFACMIPKRALTATAPAAPAPVTPAPAPAPVAPPPTTLGQVPEMTPEVKRRIQALAAHLRAVPPNFDDAASVNFWGSRLGDYGAKVTQHTVTSGETFASVAGQYYGDSTAYRGIRVYNNITSEWLYVGQRIQVPLMGKSPMPSDYVPDPSALSFSIGMDEEEELPTAMEYDDLETLNAGFSFAPDIEG